MLCPQQHQPFQEGILCSQREQSPFETCSQVIQEVFDCGRIKTQAYSIFSMELFPLGGSTLPKHCQCFYTFWENIFLPIAFFRAIFVSLFLKVKIMGLRNGVRMV